MHLAKSLSISGKMTKLASIVECIYTISKMLVQSHIFEAKLQVQVCRAVVFKISKTRLNKIEIWRLSFLNYFDFYTLEKS